MARPTCCYSGHPALRPSGPPSAVRNRSRRFCRPECAPSPPRRAQASARAGERGRRAGGDAHSRPDDVGATSAPRVRSFASCSRPWPTSMYATSTSAAARGGGRLRARETIAAPAATVTADAGLPFRRCSGGTCSTAASGNACAAGSVGPVRRRGAGRMPAEVLAAVGGNDGESRSHPELSGWQRRITQPVLRVRTSSSPSRR